jgi:hypothetical protein
VNVTVGRYPGKEVTLHVPDGLGYRVAADGGFYGYGCAAKGLEELVAYALEPVPSAESTPA